MGDFRGGVLAAAWETFIQNGWAERMQHDRRTNMSGVFAFGQVKPMRMDKVEE